MPYRCPKCKGTEFYAHQLQRYEVVVDRFGEWNHNNTCYDAEKPYGPYECVKCGAEADELDGFEKFEEEDETEE